MKLLKFNEMYKGELGNISRIKLTDFMGNEFSIIEDNYDYKKRKILFNRDEIEMIIEDFEEISKIYDLKLVDPFRTYPGSDAWYLDVDNYWRIEVIYDYYEYRDFIILIGVGNEYYDDEFAKDINSFIDRQRNMGFRVDLEDPECGGSVGCSSNRIVISKDNSTGKYIKKFESIKENESKESDEPDFNKVSIELTDLKGNKFELRSDKTLFDQDEVEMILEDFEVIPKLHNINLHSENHEYLYDNSDFYQFYRVCFAGSIYNSWGEEYILFELYLDELPNDVEEDLYSFINKIKNYGFNTIYNRKECNENGDKYSYIDITIEKI